MVMVVLVGFVSIFVLFVCQFCLQIPDIHSSIYRSQICTVLSINPRYTHFYLQIPDIHSSIYRSHIFTVLSTDHRYAQFYLQITDMHSFIYRSQIYTVLSTDHIYTHFYLQITDIHSCVYRLQTCTVLPTSITVHRPLHPSPPPTPCSCYIWLDHMLTSHPTCSARRLPLG